VIVDSIPSELRGRFVLVSVHNSFFIVDFAGLKDRQPQFFYFQKFLTQSKFSSEFGKIVQHRHYILACIQRQAQVLS
tara:strand:- start:36 stop:266 length:231 start_codon:yes stop_codon:yes gene_type:complete